MPPDMYAKTPAVKSLRLFLVRHGQVAANREFRHVGQQDDALTELGEEQATQLGDCLAQVPLAALYASPLRRTTQTAAKIATALGLDIIAEPRLAERSYGEWEGLSRSEIRERSDADRELLKRSVRDLDAAPPGGESLRSVRTRVLDLVEELAQSHAGDSVALVSHVGPIKVLLAAAFDLSLAQVGPFFLDPGTITVVDWGQPTVLRLFNSHAHQGWDRARWMG